MQLKVIHSTKDVNLNKEKIILIVCRKISTKLKLPQQITVILKNLEPAVYAETILNSNSYRIVINSQLTINETIAPLVHELIHINQIYTGKLVGKKGSYFWEGIEYKAKNGLSQSFNDYRNMPWEMDVNQKLPKLLEFVLS